MISVTNLPVGVPKRGCGGVSRVLLTSALVLFGCTSSPRVPDAGITDAGAVDAGPSSDGGALCGCTPGLHDANIFILGQDAELYRFDPLTLAAELVVAPTCATTDRVFSMAIDPQGRAWIEYAMTRRLLTIDVNDLGACEDSGYLPTLAELPLFGMSFVQRGACATLYGFSYDGEGLFEEGPGLGVLARIEGDPLRAAILSSVDYDGGELAGTGDGRLFAFTGDSPAKLVEYDPDDGSTLETHPLDGFSKTNASAFAFFGGDIYLFTEAQPPECRACLETTCSTAWAACEADAFCASQVECAIERASITDDCGGGASAEMHTCLDTCAPACLTPPRARLSQVTRVDWDRSDGAGRALTVEVPELPIRVVGAATSPCVPTVPF